MQAERTQKKGGMVMCATVLLIMCFVMLVLLIIKEIILWYMVIFHFYFKYLVTSHWSDLSIHIPSLACWDIVKQPVLEKTKEFWGSQPNHTVAEETILILLQYFFFCFATAEVGRSRCVRRRAWYSMKGYTRPENVQSRLYLYLNILCRRNRVVNSFSCFLGWHFISFSLLMRLHLTIWGGWEFCLHKKKFMQ